MGYDSLTFSPTNRTKRTKRTQENGYDAKLGGYLEAKDYDIDLVTDGGYSKGTLVRIIVYLDQENRALKKQIESLEAKG